MKVSSAGKQMLWRLVVWAALAVVIVGCAAVMTGCGPTKEPPPNETIVYQSVPYECGEPPGVDPVTMQKVTWQVATIEGIKHFTLTGAMYTALMNNLTNVASSAKQKDGVADFYADCIERSRKAHTNAGSKPDPPPK